MATPSLACGGPYRVAATVLALLLAAAPAAAQELRWPPNAHGLVCLRDAQAEGFEPSTALYKSTSFSASGSTRRIEFEFKVVNRCSRDVRVIGLPLRGDKIVQGAAIEIAAMGIAPDGSSQELGVGSVQSFTVGPGLRVTVRGTIRLRRGAKVRDVAYVTAWGNDRGGVCAHFSDRPCGAYQ